jgi:hypothetical protein
MWELRHRNGGNSESKDVEEGRGVETTGGGGMRLAISESGIEADVPLLNNIEYEQL